MYYARTPPTVGHLIVPICCVQVPVTRGESRPILITAVRDLAIQSARGTHVRTVSPTAQPSAFRWISMHGIGTTDPAVVALPCSHSFDGLTLLPQK